LEQRLKEKWDEKDRKEKKRKMEIVEIKRKKRRLIVNAEKVLEKAKVLKGGTSGDQKVETSGAQTVETSGDKTVEEETAEIPVEQLHNYIDLEEVEGDLVVHEEGMRVDPLAVQVPICDWFAVTINKRTFYKLVRVDGSYKNYVSFTRIIKDITREDLNDMYQIGKRKYGDYRSRSFDYNIMIYEALEMMYEPESVPEKIGMYTPILSWIHYEKCGVYSLNRGGAIHYFLVEKEYNHHFDVLLGMLECHLVANTRSAEAIELISKIINQVNKFRKGNQA
jgi:hypothetical protein